MYIGLQRHTSSVLYNWTCKHPQVFPSKNGNYSIVSSFIRQTNNSVACELQGLKVRGRSWTAELLLAFISDYHESFWDQQLPNTAEEPHVGHLVQSDLSVRRE